MNWQTDNQFTTETISNATPNGDGDGWTLFFEGGMGLWCASDECKQAPEPGEMVRLYGSFGYPVRGIVIGDRVYRYQTEEQAKADHEATCAKWRREQDEREAKHRAEIAKGQHAPVAFKIKESARADWERGLAVNTDPYGRCCYQFAAEWASLMEPLIADGIPVAECASDCSSKADAKYGISGFMYGVAVSLLAHCWEHGEELRRWHNKDTQVGTEGDKANESGGVLNPAVLTVG